MVAAQNGHIEKGSVVRADRHSEQKLDSSAVRDRLQAPQTAGKMSWSAPWNNSRPAAGSDFMGRAFKSGHGWNTDETRKPIRVRSVFHPWLEFLRLYPIYFGGEHQI